MSASRASAGWLLLTAALVASCVSRVELDGAPCPCGPGASCCASLKSCIPAGVTCPEAYPASTASSCARDADCARTEACHAWREAAGQPLLGPRQCRRRCEPSIPCASGESCQPAAHDGEPLDQLKTLGLCLDDATGEAGADAGLDRGPGDSATDTVSDGGELCTGWSCKGCPTDTVGRTFCEGNNVLGCLVSTHPSCGLRCEKVLVKECERCIEPTSGAVTCEGATFTPIDPCISLRCDQCPAGKVSFCEGSALKTCLRIDYDGLTCQELCVVRELETCAKGCLEEGPLARCEP